MSIPMTIQIEKHMKRKGQQRREPAKGLKGKITSIKRKIIRLQMKMRQLIYLESKQRQLKI